MEFGIFNHNTMTLSIIASIALGISLTSIWRSFITAIELNKKIKILDEHLHSLNSRLKDIEQNTNKWNSYGEILGYEEKETIQLWGFEKETVLTKWNALLEYLKIEWKEEVVKPHFEKIK